MIGKNSFLAKVVIIVAVIVQVSLDIQLARNQGRLKGYEGADNSRIRETRLSDPLLESILGVSE